MRLLGFFETRARWQTLSVCVGLAVIIGAAEFASGSARPLFLLLYLIPILVASFFAGQAPGAALATLCAALSMVGHPGMAGTLDRASELGIFLALALLTSGLRQQHLSERAALDEARGRALRSETAVAQARESILITDVLGVIRYVNPAFTRITGYALEEALGQNVRMLRSGTHTPAFYADLWTTILAGRVWHGDMTNLRKDGSLFVERTTIVPVQNEVGETSHFIALKEVVPEREPAERALESERALSESIVGSIPGISYVFDRAGRLVRWNRNYEILAGAHPEGLQGSDILQTVVEEDKAHIRQTISDAFESGELHQAECRVRDARGEIRDYLVTGQRSEVDGNAFIVGAGFDITARKRAEDAHRESQQQLAAIIDSAMDGIVSVDEEGRIILFNAAAEATFRMSAAAAIGQPLERFVPERFREAYRSRLRSQGATESRSAPAGMIGLRADGEEFPMEVSLSRVAVAGRTIVTAILRDITNRKRAQDEQERLQTAIRTAAEEWLRTFDAMSDPVVILDGANRIHRLNRAARDTVGGDYGDWLGRTLADLHAGEPWRSVAKLVTELREGGSVSPRQVRDETDGRRWHVTVTPMREQSDRFIVVVRDVTQMVELEKSVREAETMAAMGSLVAGVAHEVRNPLFAISVNVDALVAELEDESDLGEVVDALRREVGRLSVFMESLLEYGKPATAAIAEERLDGVIETAIQSCAALAAAADVTIGSNARNGPWMVRMNRGRLSQVFENLLKNAIQHSPRGSEVSVEADITRLEDGCWVRCRVSDRGRGIAPEDLPRIFEPFFSRRRGGTGLGLAIVHRVVQEHGGRIEAHNRAEGGAVMLVELPCVGS